MASINPNLDSMWAKAKRGDFKDNPDGPKIISSKDGKEIISFLDDESGKRRVFERTWINNVHKNWTEVPYLLEVKGEYR